jgi:hypothetical protein
MARAAEAAHALSRSDWGALAFGALYTAVATPVALSSGNQEFVFYIAVMALLAGVVVLVHRRVGLHALTVWGLALWGLLHMAGGLLHVSDTTGVLYNLWLVPGRIKFDHLVHAYGFGLCTWIAWQGLGAGLGRVQPTLGLLFLCTCAGMGLGALNEVVEFAATLLVPETNVGGYENTGWDLVSNMTGSVTAAALIRWRSR